MRSRAGRFTPWGTPTRPATRHGRTGVDGDANESAVDEQGGQRDVVATTAALPRNRRDPLVRALDAVAKPRSVADAAIVIRRGRMAARPAAPGCSPQPLSMARRSP
ncbi:hypothetical protein [Jiangella asiatica]|uniref:Uncharacterized protein n=1 Tax=Jiangella asiatica TaxID=2530372 RepID=A0A4R5DJM0_9ACTN|nr:hypothetical protein [Jiangella asiatica]TDE12190.1 hypothetical protein E1269_07815 [Jiangella asiatica]